MVATDTIQWGPVITVMLTAFIGIIGYFVRSVSRTLGDHGTALAVLIAETRPGLKIQDEVIDLKLASAELDVARKDHDKRITSLETTRERRP